MKIRYDPVAHAVYISLVDIPDGGVAHTEDLVPDVLMVDRTEDGEVCGLEFLDIDSVKFIVGGVKYTPKEKMGG